MHSSDLQAIKVMECVRPVWTDLISARDVVAIGEQMILHAGPPLLSSRIPKAILNSATAAILFEGWTNTPEQAHEMLLSGEVTLKPAQELGVVVPLASVLSPSMLVLVVTDRNNPQIQSFSPINGGMTYALRLGLPDKNVLQHLHWLNGSFGDSLKKAIPEEGIELIPLADHALSQGDDCHGRTVAATGQLLACLEARLSRVENGDKSIEYIEHSPPFFLNLWMAASKLIMLAATDTKNSSVITSIGGNGLEFGIQIAGLPGYWVTTPAKTPTAIYEPGFSKKDGLGAIGDSAVIEGLGLGAMAIRFSPIQRKYFCSVLPPEAFDLPRNVLSKAHSSFEKTNALFGTTVRQIIQMNTSMIIALGVIDIEGKKGRVGGGIYRPPIDIFDDIYQTLNKDI